MTATDAYRVVARDEPDEEGVLGWDVFFDGDEEAPAVESPVGWAPTRSDALDVISDIEDHRGR